MLYIISPLAGIFWCSGPFCIWRFLRLLPITRNKQPSAASHARHSGLNSQHPWHAWLHRPPSTAPTTAMWRDAGRPTSNISFSGCATLCPEIGQPHSSAVGVVSHDEPVSVWKLPLSAKPTRWRPASARCPFHETRQGEDVTASPKLILHHALWWALPCQGLCLAAAWSSSCIYCRNTQTWASPPFTTTRPRSHLTHTSCWMREASSILLLVFFSPPHCFFLQSKALYPDGMFLWRLIGQEKSIYNGMTTIFRIMYIVPIKLAEKMMSLTIIHIKYH